MKRLFCRTRPFPSKKIAPQIHIAALPNRNFFAQSSSIGGFARLEYLLAMVMRFSVDVFMIGFHHSVVITVILVQSVFKNTSV